MDSANEGSSGNPVINIAFGETNLLDMPFFGGAQAALDPHAYANLLQSNFPPHVDPFSVTNGFPSAPVDYTGTTPWPPVEETGQAPFSFNFSYPL